MLIPTFPSSPEACPAPLSSPLMFAPPPLFSPHTKLASHFQAPSKGKLASTSRSILTPLYTWGFVYFVRRLLPTPVIVSLLTLFVESKLSYKGPSLSHIF